MFNSVILPKWQFNELINCVIFIFVSRRRNTILYLGLSCVHEQGHYLKLIAMYWWRCSPWVVSWGYRCGSSWQRAQKDVTLLHCDSKCKKREITQTSLEIENVTCLLSKTVMEHTQKKLKITVILLFMVFAEMCKRTGCRLQL